MLRTFLFTCVLGTVLAATNSTTNGVTVSADTSILQKIEQAYWVVLQKKINGIKLPDFESKSDTAMYVKDNDFSVTEPADHFNFFNDVANNCLKIQLNKLSAKFKTNNFHAHYGIFGAYGTATMTIDTTKLIFGYRVTTQALPDGRIVPAIETCDFDFGAFDTGDLSFDVSGSFWDGAIDMFKSLYEGKIVDAIKGIVQKELTVTLVTDLNKMIAESDGFAHIKSMPEWWLDFAEQEAGQISDTSIELGIRGIFFDHLFNETLAPTFPVMNYKDPAIPSELQAFVSQQTVNSALTSFLQVHPIEGFFNATDIPAGSKVNLTTGLLEKAFKGISAYYGADQPVDVKYSLNTVYDFAVTKDFPNLSLWADADLQFYVETVNGTSELAVDLAVSKFEFDGSIDIVNGTSLSTNITKLKVHGVTVKSCSFGKIGTFKLQMGLNVALAVLAPKIAAKLDSIQIPTSILGHINLSDMVVAYYDQYFGIGVTPTFVAPPLPTPPVGATYASRVCIFNNAGFVLQWYFKDKYTKEISAETEHYPIAQEKCMEINEALPNVREGEMIQSIVEASGGTNNRVDHLVVYTGAEVKTVTYTCTGTTLIFSCTDDANNEVTLTDLINLADQILQ